MSACEHPFVIKFYPHFYWEIIMRLRYLITGLVLIPLTIFSQQLEVVSVFPPQNDNTATANTQIRVDFNMPVDTAGIESRFVVLGSMNGLYPANVSVDPSLQSVVLQPTTPFFIGERVNVTIRTALAGSGGESFQGFNWQFRIKPTWATPPHFSQLKVFNLFSGWYYNTMYPADVNNDSHLDIVILSYPIQIVINDGLGNFTLSQQLLNIDNENADIPITDLDLDGFKEIVCIAGIYEADSSGVFQFVQPFNHFVYDIADMNGDAYPDLITRDPIGENASIIGISYNDGFGHFSALDTIIIDSVIIDAAAGDLNNDGINDIAYATQAFPTPGGTDGHHSLRIAYLSSTGDILYRDIYNQEDFPYQALFFPHQVSTLDLNNDNYMDLFVGSMDNFIVLNDPQDGFAIDSALIVGGGGEGYGRTIFGDISGDGWEDHIYFGQYMSLDGGVCRYNINLGGYFGSVWGQDLEVRNGALPFCVTAGDFNGDGSQDIAILWNDGLHIYFNDDQVSIAKLQNNFPEQFTLYQNYPNPFNGETSIQFYLPQAEEVQSIIYDITGKEVKSYYSIKYPQGNNVIKWDARNQHGKEVSSGIYIWKFKTQGFEKSIKIALIR